MSFYQTYRPKKIAELDLTEVREVLLSTLASGKLSHAYLFVGPRGSGKTSTARIFAQIINCKENQGKIKSLSEPCGVCEACQAIGKGSGVDVIEIDAASNGLVDDIRELRERVKLSPVLLPKKVYIIDEVHMVSSAGFNALLKTLEEPPAHALFILCTTESQKVPETIVSRCTRINFSKATVEEIIRSLKKAVEGEGLKVDGEILKEVAEATDGSFREGHKILEQLSSYGKKITSEVLTKVLGVASRQSVKKLLDLAVAGKNEEVIETFDKMEKNGTKAAILASTLLNEAKMEMEKAMKKGEKAANYVVLINNLIVAADRVKISPLPLLPLEIALLSVGLAGEEGPRPKVELPAQEKEKAADTVIKSGPKVEMETEAISMVSLEEIKNHWVEFLNSMAESNGSLAGMLRLVSPMAVQGKSLTLSVTSRFQQEMLEKENKKKVIEEQMSKLWGPTTYRCVLIDKAPRTEVLQEDENVVSMKGDMVNPGGVMSVAEKIFGN